MPNLYNRIQGRSLERLAALSDGIFAVAMTLLVLDLHIPTAAQVHSEGELLGALAALGLKLILDKVSGRDKRLGSLEAVLIEKGLSKKH